MKKQTWNRTFTYFVVATLVAMSSSKCGREEESIDESDDEQSLSDHDIDSALEGFNSNQLVYGSNHTSLSGIFRNKFPFILAHGLGASAEVFSLQPVAVRLRQRGYQVFVTEVSSFNTIAYRAEQLRHQVDRILQNTNSAKVNIIAHSMGGLDARYLISTLGYGDRVASLSTISTPHRGSPRADKLVENADNLLFNGRIFIRFLDRFGASISGDFNEVDAAAAITNLTVSYMSQVFNPNNLDDPRVYYQSWGGHSSLSAFPDRVNVLLRSSYRSVYSREGDNDGLVSLSSARWGRFGVIPADHMDQVGVNLRSASPQFKFLDFYEGVAEGLVSQGF